MATGGPKPPWAHAALEAQYKSTHGPIGPHGVHGPIGAHGQWGKPPWLVWAHGETHHA